MSDEPYNPYGDIPSVIVEDVDDVRIVCNELVFYDNWHWIIALVECTSIYNFYVHNV